MDLYSALDCSSDRIRNLHMEPHLKYNCEATTSDTSTTTESNNNNNEESITKDSYNQSSVAEGVLHLFPLPPTDLFMDGIGIFQNEVSNTEESLFLQHFEVAVGDYVIISEEESSEVQTSGDSVNELLLQEDNGSSGQASCGGTTVVCELCGQGFAHSRSLILHNQVRHSDNARPFLCNTCGKSFKVKQNLVEHARIHLEKRHICSLCDKKFTRKRSLTRHMLTHQRSNVYKCSKCDFSASVRRTFNEHMDKVHIEESQEYGNKELNNSASSQRSQFKVSGKKKKTPVDYLIDELNRGQGKMQECQNDIKIIIEQDQYTNLVAEAKEAQAHRTIITALEKKSLK